MGKALLMCPPTFYGVEYEINPWMHVDNPVDIELARDQWYRLYDLYVEELGWSVSLIDAVPGLPDMVFTANGGLVVDGKTILPQFRQPERQGETEHFERWFCLNGYQNPVRMAHDFEGEGDALLWRDVLFAAYPWRSDQAAHRELESILDVEIVGLQLVDARFYHLDTAFAVIDERTVAIYPAAFSAQSLRRIRSFVPNVIEATDEDALAYGLNSLSDGENVVISDMAYGLIETYRAQGRKVWPTPIGEFQKSGGGVKCMTLELRS
ncbi:dimethylargininase [Thauera sp.]|uniref:dimethylargininase n=1 Tax=Thauera sp. TaxID=1905334 RepID=UPI0039E45226